MCFNAAGANGADSRWKAGTGIGVQFYYFGGGATSAEAASFKSPYCYGWHQAIDANNRIHEYYFNYYNEAWYIFFDIEGEDNNGWGSVYPKKNRQVFNGFWDNIAGHADNGGCTGGTTGGYQPAAYSSPKLWNYSFNSTIANTPEWTSEYCCISHWTGGYSYNGNSAHWFGGSNYHAAWQFHQAPDRDVAKEPEYLPLFNKSIGN